MDNPDFGWNLDRQKLDIWLDLESEGLITERHEYDYRSRRFNKCNLQSYLVFLYVEEPSVSSVECDITEVSPILDLGS